MVIRVLLSVGLLFALLYANLQQSSTRLLKLAMSLVVLFGVYLVWFPDETTALARLVGVGRGTDLILYLWIVISIIFILILHLRVNRLNSVITDLARHVALTEADGDGESGAASGGE